MPFTANKAYYKLQEIRSTEKSKLPFKGFLQPVTIDSTAGYNRLQMYRIEEHISGKEFHPSRFRSVLIILFIALFLLLLRLSLTNPQKNIEAYVIPIMFTVFFISYFLYEGFLNKKKNYNIVLNFDGIRIANEYYNWNELKETAILQIGSGRGQRDYLVLIFNDGSYKKYRTNSFLTLWGFKYALSSYIEYFKENINQ